MSPPIPIGFRPIPLLESGYKAYLKVTITSHVEVFDFTLLDASLKKAFGLSSAQMPFIKRHLYDLNMNEKIEGSFTFSQEGIFSFYTKASAAPITSPLVAASRIETELFQISIEVVKDLRFRYYNIPAEPFDVKLPQKLLITASFDEQSNLVITPDKMLLLRQFDNPVSIEITSAKKYDADGGA